MKLFNKTSLALALSLVGAASTVSALAMTTTPDKKVHHINIAADDNRDAHIMVSIDGQMTKLSVSKEALNNKELLAEELANEPEDIREKLTSALNGLHLNSRDIFFKHHQVDDNADAQRVVIMSKGDGAHHEGTRHDKVITKVINGLSGLHLDSLNDHSLKFVSDGKVAADSIVSLLSHGKYSADELDKIQQALDSKR